MARYSTRLLHRRCGGFPNGTFQTLTTINNQTLIRTPGLCHTKYHLCEATIFFPTHAHGNRSLNSTHHLHNILFSFFSPLRCCCLCSFKNIHQRHYSVFTSGRTTYTDVGPGLENYSRSSRQSKCSLHGTPAISEWTPFD